MNITTFEVEKKYVRGAKRGKREIIDIVLSSKESIYKYLWDIVDKFEKNKLHFVIENYRVKPQPETEMM